MTVSIGNSFNSSTELSYEPIAKEAFYEVIIDKQLVRSLRLEDQGIPTFVGEWLIDRERQRLASDDLEALREHVYAFVAEHLPRKDQKEVLRNRLFNGEVLMLLDQFRASVNLARGRLQVEVPSLDERGEVDPTVLEQFKGLLQGGMWGAGKLVYQPPANPPRDKGAVWLRGFKPLQAADIDLEFFKAQRKLFSLEQWIALIINSMGYNPSVYATPRVRTLLLTRLLPLIQRRLNLMELAPKGTGKSFIFSNLSRHARLISGGKVSPAVLFYNNSTNTPGLLTAYDTVVFDEAQTIAFDNAGEMVGILKDYMESGRYTRGKQKVAADAGVAFLGNIPIGSDGRPQRRVLFDELPDFLRETAFIDRIHGLIPGWDIPKVQRDSPAERTALKADYFSEVLHRLRDEGEYDAFTEQHVRLSGAGANNMRNTTAIKRLATGYLKLLFPDLSVQKEQFETYCLQPAIELRQRVCDQLAILDDEYKTTNISGSMARLQ